MRILITGSSGFIGKHLVEYLFDEGHVLFLIERKTRLDKSERISHISVDLSLPGFSELLPQGIDCIIHLAQSQRYRDFPDGTIDMMRINISSTVELLEWARVTGVKQFILTSTANVYKPSMELLTEKSPTNPSSFYGASKLSAELCAINYQQFYQVDILRCFTVFGPGQKNMLIQNLIDRVENGFPITLSKGAGIYLTPIYVSDVVKAIGNLFLLSKLNGERIVNVCGDQVVSLFELVKIIERLLNKKAILINTSEPVLSFAGSNERLKEFFGVMEFVPLEKGIELSVINTKNPH